MARVTIEDCIKKIPNRFELCMIASQRVKEINSGSRIAIEDHKKDEKVCVVALKEIASGLLDKKVLEENILKSFYDVHHCAEEDVDDGIRSDESGDYKNDDSRGVIFSGDEEGYDYEDMESDVEGGFEEEFEKN